MNTSDNLGVQVTEKAAESVNRQLPPELKRYLLSWMPVQAVTIEHDCFVIDGGAIPADRIDEMLHNLWAQVESVETPNQFVNEIRAFINEDNV
jgi:hypothetical protein